MWTRPASRRVSTWPTADMKGAHVLRVLGGRLALVGAAAAVVVAVWAAPASAHVEVSADNPQPGATNVTLTFRAESESPDAGVVSMQVVLPAGIAPGDVTYVSGPAGW